MWEYYKPRIASPLFNPLAPPLDKIGAMPKMFLHVAGHDVCRDDSLILACALQDHGVNVKLEAYPRVCHSFWAFAPGLALSTRFVSDVVVGFAWHAWLLGVGTDALMPAFKIDDAARVVP